MSEHTNLTSILSPNKLRTASLNTTVQNLDISISNNIHNETISYVKSAITLLFLQQPMDRFDALVYPYSIQGYPELTIADASQTIKNPSMSAEAYLSKVNGFTTYRKQVQAIDVYIKSFQNTAPVKKNQISIQKMENGRVEVVTPNKIQPDLISKLPIDIVNDAIMPHLTPNTNTSYLAVSKLCCNVFLYYPHIWKSLSVADGNQNPIRLFNIIPSVGPHNDDITIDTNFRAVHTDCFQFMINERLTKIESFKIKKAFSIYDQQIPHTPMIAFGLRQTSQTLMTLNPDFGNSTIFELADIFLSCTNLICRPPFIIGHRLDVVNEIFLITEQHNTLINFQIKAELIELMFQRCQQLRRIIMGAWDKADFNVINKHAPNLKISTILLPERCNDCYHVNGAWQPYNTINFLCSQKNNNNSNTLTSSQQRNSNSSLLTATLSNIYNSDISNSNNNNNSIMFTYDNDKGNRAKTDLSAVVQQCFKEDTNDSFPATTEFKSSKVFYLNNEDDTFHERGAQISDERAKLSPYDLTTNETVPQLNHLIFADLVLSTKMIFVKTNPHIATNRKKQLAYYNWIIVDLCRRMDLIQKQIVRRHGSRRLDYEMRGVIENLCNDPYVAGIRPTGNPGTIAKTRVYATIRENGEYVDFFTPFVEYKRSQVLNIVEQFGDEICLFTEFIDIKEIGDMDEEGYQDFVHDLNLCKDSLKSRIENLHFIFDKSNPIEPFNKMTLLNPDDKSK
ncbi:hypothetical protein BDC45DRAFT_602155 [Circinella umbellata]|nr:hypothetical protein BDC45DRAFT_602155 [Circinella umbellata]